jgi:hypothetical protein
MITKTEKGVKDMPAAEEATIPITVATMTFEKELKLNQRLIADARQWANVVYNRGRWRRSNALLDEIHQLALKQWKLTRFRFLFRSRSPISDRPRGACPGNSY